MLHAKLTNTCLAAVCVLWSNSLQDVAFYTHGPTGEESGRTGGSFLKAVAREDKSSPLPQVVDLRPIVCLFGIFRNRPNIDNFLCFHCFRFTVVSESALFTVHAV